MIAEKTKPNKHQHNMATEDKKKKATSTKTSADAKEKEVSKITANPKLVAALQGHDEAKGQVKSYLIEMATICQEEQLSKEEVIASIMEGRGIDRKLAGEQYSRMKGILNSPETLQELKDGVIDLQTARAKTKKSQENKSPKKAQENAEKVITRSISAILTKCKEAGISLVDIITTIKQAAKKAGLK